MKIAFIGRLRSGKDEAAYYICNKHRALRFAFADALKIYFSKLFPYLASGQKPRAYLQQFGEKMREIDENVWINALAEDLAHMEKYGAERFAITDIRHENELEWARENGFTIIKVEAAEAIRIKRARASGEIFNAADLEHDTERACDELEADYTVTNNGTLEEFYAQLDAIIDELK